MSSEEPSEGLSPREAVVLLAVVVEGGLILLACGLGWLFDEPPLKHFTWDPQSALTGLVATGPMLLLFLAMIRWPIGPLSRIKHFSEQVIRPLLAPCTVLDLLGIAVLAGLGEEMLFRAVLQGAFARWGHVWLALAVASALFGLMHAVTTAYAVLATLMGAYLGWLYLYADNLLAPALSHALYDFVALLYLLRGPGSDQTPAAAGEGDGAGPDGEGPDPGP
jgi:membrane protease YdiL (CAAX protease family)